jgi:iron(III) transport system substrate-binding protein
MRYAAGAAFILIAALPFIVRLGSHAPAVAERAGTTAETLTILSPHRREVRQEYGRGFAAWMQTRHDRHVEIRWLDVGGTAKILKELESRFATSPDNPGVDLLFGGGVAPYLTAIEQHWLAPLDLPTNLVAGIPPTCAGSPVYDPGHRWFGVALSGFGILYNRPLVERLHLPVPSDWTDLARPEYFGWVGSGDPRSSGSVHMCYEIILQAYGFADGWPILTRLCANIRSFGEAGGVVPREVAAGDIAAGMVIDQYAQTVIRSVGGDSLVLVLPKQHTMIGPDAIGLIRGTRQAELARRFVEYALSEDGQRLLYQAVGVNGQRHALYRMPVAEALYADPAAPQPNPYTIPAGFIYDNEKGMRRWNVLNDLMGVWLIDAHPDLRDAWKRLIDRGTVGSDAAALGAPPLTEQALDALAVEWKDPRRRQEIMLDWSRAAQKRYREVGR